MQVNGRSNNDERKAAVFTAAHSSCQVLGLDGLSGLHPDAGHNLAEGLSGGGLQRSSRAGPVDGLGASLERNATAFERDCEKAPAIVYSYYSFTLSSG